MSEVSSSSSPRRGGACGAAGGSAAAAPRGGGGGGGAWRDDMAAGGRRRTAVGGRWVAGCGPLVRVVSAGDVGCFCSAGRENWDSCGAVFGLLTPENSNSANHSPPFVVEAVCVGSLLRLHLTQYCA
jgi:hypothetical protein